MATSTRRVGDAVFRLCAHPGARLGDVGEGKDADLGGQHRGGGAGDRADPALVGDARARSEEHTSELQLLMRTPYAVLCLNKKNSEQGLHTQSHTIYNLM